MKVLLVDLETEWRGGQNQALLLLKGLVARGHQAELVAVAGSALEQRASVSDIPVHVVQQVFTRVRAAGRIRKLTRKQNYDIVHVNEPHALTAAWLAGVHRRSPLIRMTEVGGRKYAAIQKRQAAWVNQLAAGLKRSELATTARVLQELSNRLDRDRLDNERTGDDHETP